MARLAAQDYEVVPVTAVSLHPENAKVGDVPAIAKSIARNDFYGALVVQRSTGHILVGNHRWLAAKAENLGEVPVIYVDVDDDQARRIMVADNRTSDLGTFDMEKLSALLESFDGDLDGTGYSLDDLTDMLGTPGDGLTPPDSVPESAPALTVPGDVWVLGEHRVCCGDSTSPTDMGKLLAGEVVDLVWTDPPYNVAIEGRAGKILNDDMGAAQFRSLLDGALQSAFTALRPGGSIYVAHADSERLAFTAAFMDAGFKLSGCLIWRKNAMTLGRSDYQWRHEPILYGWRPGAAHRWFGGRKQTTISDADDAAFRQSPDGSWQIQLADRTLILTGSDVMVRVLEGSVQEYDKPTRSDLHPTMKPVALIVRHILNSSRSGDTVLDLFGGSGSTLIAAHGVGRRARVMELDPKFVDVICRRFQEHTGVAPVAEATGRPHSFLTEGGS